MRRDAAGKVRMKNLIVDIPVLKSQYCAVLHSQKRQGTTKRSRTLLEGVLNFFDDIITAADHGDGLGLLPYAGPGSVQKSKAPKLKTINVHKLQLQFDAGSGDMEMQAEDVVDRINAVLSANAGQVSNAQLVMHRDEIEVSDD